MNKSIRIMIDGCDGCGKSTLVSRLVKEYGLDIIQMTREGSKCLYDYYQKAFLRNVVSDRGFISEHVYSKVYDRKTEVDDETFENLMDEYSNWPIIILTAKPKVILERVNKRGTDKEVFTELVNKVDAYKNVWKKIKKRKNTLLIDTTKMTPDKVFKRSKEFIDEHTR